MSQKIPVLITVCHIVEVDRDELDKDHSVLDKVDNQLSRDKQLQVEGNGNINLKWESTSRMVLDPESTNCGRCDVCGSWVTDVERPAVIEALNPGARVNGMLLCDEHLPRDHRTAFNKQGPFSE